MKTMASFACIVVLLMCFGASHGWNCDAYTPAEMLEDMFYCEGKFFNPLSSAFLCYKSFHDFLLPYCQR